MELTIDKFGRVVLPKKLRQHLGVGRGLKIQVSETAEGLLLTPTRRESALMVKDGVLMLRGSPEDARIDLRKVLEEDREEHIRHIVEA